MTIVDVALHKWRMLDDRRRRILLATIVFVILLNVWVIYLIATKHKEAPEPEPSSTTTSAPETTTAATTTPRPPSKPVASANGLALAELTGSLVVGEESSAIVLDLPGLEALEVEPEGKSEEQRFRVNLKLLPDDLEISCSFLKTDKTLEADQVTLSWTRQGVKKQCSLLHGPDKANFFRSEPGKHYKCSKKLTYDCTSGTTEEAHLLIENLELEFNREKPVDQADLKFETPTFECPS